MNVLELMATLTLNTAAYERGLQNARKSADTSGGKIGSAFGVMASVAKKAFAVASVAGVAFAKSSIDTGQAFESAISQVAATMGKGVEDIADIEAKAKELGATTQFTATQTAQAFNYLALAGYDSEKAIGNIGPVLNLAAAGSMDLAKASDMVTDAMSALGIVADNEGVNVSAFGDAMARTASRTNTSVSQLGEAILTVGGTAKTLKGGVVELDVALGTLANSGIKGSEGGTHLRNVLLSLQNPTKETKEMFDALGISVYDSNGDMRYMNDILMDLNASMEGMTTAEKQNIIGTIFNKTDLAAVNALLAGCGDQWSALTDEIENSGGAMANMADTQMDNLQGALTFLSSALDGLKLAFYDTFSDKLKVGIQGITGVVAELTTALSSGGIQGVVSKIGDMIINEVPKLADAGVKMAKSIIDNLASGLESGVPKIIGKALPMILSFSESLRSNAGTLVDAGLNLIMNLANGLIASIPTLIQYVPQIITNIAGIINDNAPKLLVTAGVIMWNLAVGLIEAIPTIIECIPQIFEAIISVWTAFNWANLGKTVVINVVNGIKTLPTQLKSIATNAVNWIKTTFLGGGIESVVSGIFATVRNVMTAPINAAVGIIKSTVATVTNPFQSTFEKVVSIVVGAIAKVKGAFKFSWSLPPLKIPHISVSGGVAPFGLGGAGSLPKFSIQWYSQAMNKPMILDAPTIFGAAGGKFLGGGEAGREVVAGADTLMGMIREASGRGNDEIIALLRRILAAILDGHDIYIDGNKWIGHTAEGMNRKLGSMAEAEMRGAYA